MDRDEVIKQKYVLMKQYYDRIEELDKKKGKIAIEYGLGLMKIVEYTMELESINKEMKKCKDKIDSIELELRAFGIRL